MARIHLTEDYQRRLKEAVADHQYDTVQAIVVDASTLLTRHLRLNEIGMEWFSVEMRAILAAAGW